MPDTRDKGVIFDLDGVLVDTGRFHKQSWYDLAAIEGWDLTDEFFYKTFGMQNGQIIPMLAGGGMPPDEVGRLGDWKEERYRELIGDQLCLLEGVEELLADLQQNGFRLAIGSSTPRANLDFMLERIAVRDRFDAYVTGEDVKHGKPAPDTFLQAAQKLGLAPAQCVVVEDAVQGVEAGKAAGMAVVAVTTTRPREALHNADLVVDSLADVTAAEFARLLP